MSSNPHVRRFTVASKASAMLMAAMLLVGTNIDVRQPRGRAIDQILGMLAGPGWKIGEWLLPGHDLNRASFWVLCSMIFNAGVLWLILSLWAWFRGRTSNESNSSLKLR